MTLLIKYLDYLLFLKNAFVPFHLLSSIGSLCIRVPHVWTHTSSCQIVLKLQVLTLKKSCYDSVTWCHLPPPINHSRAEITPRINPLTTSWWSSRSRGLTTPLLPHMSRWLCHQRQMCQMLLQLTEQALIFPQVAVLSYPLCLGCYVP